MKRIITLIAALLAVSAFAQSNPGLQFGQIPSAGQWNSYFSAKQDYFSGGIPITNGGTGSISASGARANLGLGTIATQDASNVNITGGTITGITVTTNNLSGGAIGAVPYQSAANATTFLFGNTTTTPQFYTSTGTGSAALAPTLTSSTGTGSVTLSISPTITTPTLNTPTLSGATTAGTINKLTLTAPATSATLTIADGKTLTASNSITLAGTDGKTLTTSNSLTLAGTDGTTMTFPSTSATIARTDGANTFSSGAQTFNGTVAGTALSTYLASPPAIGGSAAAAGAFTTLSASSTVSGTGFSTYLASPPAIGGTSASTITGTTVRANTQYNVGANLLISTTAPTVTSCGTGGGTSVNAPNGTVAFRVTTGATATSACTLNLPTAATGWNCFASDITTPATGNVIRMSSSNTTTVILTSYNSSGTPTNWTGSDVLAVNCMAF